MPMDIKSKTIYKIYEFQFSFAKSQFVSLLLDEAHFIFHYFCLIFIFFLFPTVKAIAMRQSKFCSMMLFYINVALKSLKGL